MRLSTCFVALKLGLNATLAQTYAADAESVTGGMGFTGFVGDGEAQFSPHAPALAGTLATDAYEPDDAANQASVFEVGVAQTHNLHASNDVDWVRFYAPSGFVFNIQETPLGTNSDLALDIYHEQPDGSLQWVSGVDDYPAGAGLGYKESIALDLKGTVQDPAGFYLVRVSSADPRLFGVGSEYSLEIFSAQGGGSIIVVAIDKLNNTRSPPGAVALWDGTNVQSFGAANSLLLDLPEGVHTVRVSVASGYLPEEDPAVQGQVTNLTSYWYGNPKRAKAALGSPGMAVFQFVPITTARGTVVDRLTGEPVAGARLVFRANSGALAGLTYDGYPNSASYKSPWVTTSDGDFPSNVWLPTSGWDLMVSCADYTNLVCTPAVTFLPAGGVTNIGKLLLAPVDLNANGVSDAWERRYGITNCASNSDADGDGVLDREEYLAGTDPTNSRSVFQILEMIKSLAAAECGVRWNAVGGRSYRVFWSDTPGAWSAGQSVQVGATNTWQDNSDPKPSVRFYRVAVELP